MSQNKNECMERLDSFKEFEYNWDNEGAHPIDSRAIEFAKNNIEALINIIGKYTHIYIYPTRESGVQLEWDKEWSETHSDYLSLEIDSTATNLYCHILENVKSGGRNTYDKTGQWEKDIVPFLNKYYGKQIVRSRR